MNENTTDNLELFYDCIDESNNILYEVFHKDKSYFDLLEMTLNNIINSKIVCDVSKEAEEKLEKVYDTIADIDFSVEDVRKALQAIILKAFKEVGMPNGNTTPDTLGMLITYLLSKIHTEKTINILDPLCGTGNLLFTVVNHLADKECNVIGCDSDELMVKLTSLSAELLNQPIEILLQDTATLSLGNLDSIIFDLPNNINTDVYLPYNWILNYSKMLNDNGSIVAIVPNDFFDHDKNKDFRKQLLETMSIIGFIELPDDMFISKPKCILVLQKVKLDDMKCFMVKLPGFSDVKEFNNSLLEIEHWFDKYKKNNKSEEEV